MRKNRDLQDIQNILEEAGILSEEDEAALKRKEKRKKNEKKLDPIDRSLSERKSKPKPKSKAVKKGKKKDPEINAPMPPVSTETLQGGEGTFPLRRGEGLAKNTQAMLEFTDRYLEARLTIVPVAGDPIDRNFMERFLLYRGVKYGIDWDAVDSAIALANKMEVIQEELIAVGEMPVEGKDAHVNVYFEKGGMHKRLKNDLGNSTVDHQALFRINMVSEGQMIAEKIAMIEGENGRNVRSEIVYAQGSRDFPLKPGKNTEMNERGEVFALVDGRPILDDLGHVSVIQIYTVIGDVDINVGNLEFKGDIDILGSVRSGYSVLAGGSINVSESVEAATLIAQENLTIKGGYTGGSKGLIQSGGNTNLAHVNTGSIEVGGDLRVSTELINVKAFVCGSLSFFRGRGSIRGGTLFVQNDLDVYELGSELGVSTTVHLGHFEVCRRQLKGVQSDLLDLNDQIRILSEGLDKLNSGAVAASMPRKKQSKAVEKLTSALEHLKLEKKELESEASELEREMEKYRPCFVRVEGTIYPGVRIYVGKAEFQVTKPMNKVEFYVNPGSREIKHRPYRAKVNKES